MRNPASLARKYRCHDTSRPRVRARPLLPGGKGLDSMMIRWRLTRSGINEFRREGNLRSALGRASVRDRPGGGLRLAGCI